MSNPFDNINKNLEQFSGKQVKSIKADGAIGLGFSGVTEVVITFSDNSFIRVVGTEIVSCDGEQSGDGVLEIDITLPQSSLVNERVT